MTQSLWRAGQFAIAVASLPLLFAPPAHAADVTVASDCMSYVKAFASRTGPDGKAFQPYRPLISFEPAPRLGSDDHRAPANLILPLNATTLIPPDDQPTMIGGYKVTGVPVLRMEPRDEAAAYYLDPQNGAITRIPNTCFQNPAFQQAVGFSVGRLELEQGDSLGVKMTSALPYKAGAAGDKPQAAKYGGAPCQSSNLHTHGLLVRPTHGAGASPYGDYVLDLAMPSLGDRLDACGANVTHGVDNERDSLTYLIQIPSDRWQDPTTSGSHPSGLFWFHPHPHGYSASQVRGGTTGLITIGQLSDYLASNQGAPFGRKANMRFFMLKDTQVERKDAKANYAYSYGYGAQQTGHDPVAKKDVSFAYCGDTSLLTESAATNRGECAKSTPKNIDRETARDGRWLFTVNGVVYPRIVDADPEQPEIWRLANASANTSYRLQVRRDPSKTCDVPGNCLPLRILSKDGVSINEPNGKQANTTMEILLMPGSRVEIMLEAKPTDAEFHLVTAGANTGGDAWPAIALASVEWKGAARDKAIARANTAPAKPVAINVAGPRRPPALAEVKPARIEPANPCDWNPSLERVILFVKKTDPKDPDVEKFGIISAFRYVGDTSRAAFYFRVDPATKAWKRVNIVDELPSLFAPDSDKKKLTDANWPTFGSAPDLGFVCSHRSATDETWVIENWTDEDHNFHIHQSRFATRPRVSTAAVDQRYFAFPCAGGASKAARSFKGCYGQDQSPAAMDRLIGEFYNDASLAAQLGQADIVYHDSVPIPRGVGANCNSAPYAAGCDPGRATIQIKFSRAEQVGEFVFHCHILEHEDKGMMARIVVHPSLQEALASADADPAKAEAGASSHASMGTGAPTGAVAN